MSGITNMFSTFGLEDALHFPNNTGNNSNGYYYVDIHAQSIFSIRIYLRDEQGKIPSFKAGLLQGVCYISNKFKNVLNSIRD